MPLRRALGHLTCVLALSLVLLSPRVCLGFCGFFAGKSDATLVSEASSLVIMREGQRTALTLQPYYRGPIEDFSMILPVPSVIRRHQVKVLEPALLEQVDSLTAPRLVEYWEQDPCSNPHPERHTLSRGMIQLAGTGGSPSPVRVEAKFVVGEYEIVVLGARDSLALERWLRRNDYRIPAGASEALRPYVAAGTRFLVARVNANKVEFDGDRALLSPLRLHYDSPELSVPVRLGLLNADGPQDLVVTVLARGDRYEAANRPNITIPTNLDLRPKALGQFDEFYAALLDHSFAAAPEAVITEYAWEVTSCDPCTAGDVTLGFEELLNLGLDVMPVAPALYDAKPYQSRYHHHWDEGAPIEVGDPTGPVGWREWPDPDEFTVTRLHLRVAPGDEHRDDLVLRRSGPILGGREGVDGEPAPRAAQATGAPNFFQARYAVRHPWTGPIACESPRFGVWGGPPSGKRRASSVEALETPAYSRTTRSVSEFLAHGEFGAQDYDGVIEAEDPIAVEPLVGSARCSVDDEGPVGLGWAGLALLGLWFRRKRRLQAA